MFFTLINFSLISHSLVFPLSELAHNFKLGLIRQGSQRTTHITKQAQRTLGLAPPPHIWCVHINQNRLYHTHLSPILASRMRGEARGPTPSGSQFSPFRLPVTSKKQIQGSLNAIYTNKPFFYLPHCLRLPLSSASESVISINVQRVFINSHQVVPLKVSQVVGIVDSHKHQHSRQHRVVFGRTQGWDGSSC